MDKQAATSRMSNKTNNKRVAEYIFVCQLWQSKPEKRKDIQVFHGTGYGQAQYKATYSHFKAVVWDTVGKCKLETSPSTVHEQL